MHNLKARKVRKWGYSVSLIAALAGGISSMAENASAGRIGGSIPQTVVDAIYVVRTIHYVYEDGTTAAPDVTERLKFKESDGNWVPSEVSSDANYTFTPNDDTFDAVTSPVISGYTADQTTVPEVTGVRPTTTVEESAASDTDIFADNFEVIVTYKKNSEVSAPETDSPAAPEFTSPIGEQENLTQITTEPVATIAGPAVTAVPSKSSGQVLPSTGEESINASIIAKGVGSIAGAAYIATVVYRKRKRK